MLEAVSPSHVKAKLLSKIFVQQMHESGFGGLIPHKLTFIIRLSFRTIRITLAESVSAPFKFPRFLPEL